MLKFHEIQDTDKEIFKDAIQIYVDSFPDNQRLSVDLMIRRVQEGIHQIFVGLLKDKAVFMATLHPLKNTDFILLEYLATDENFRGQGIGKLFFQYISQVLKDNHKYLVIEVENPDFGDEQENKIRRINFYKKLGAIEIKDVRYILPPLTGDITTEMKLLTMPEYHLRKINKGLIKRVIQEIYQQVYSRNENDKILNSFIHDIDTSANLI